MAIHTLIDLDFTPGIKAEYINQNFNLHQQKIKEDTINKAVLRIIAWKYESGIL